MEYLRLGDPRKRPSTRVSLPAPEGPEMTKSNPGPVTGETSLRPTVDAKLQDSHGSSMNPGSHHANRLDAPEAGGRRTRRGTAGSAHPRCRLPRRRAFRPRFRRTPRRPAPGVRHLRPTAERAP